MTIVNFLSTANNTARPPTNLVAIAINCGMIDTIPDTITSISLVRRFRISPECISFTSPYCFFKSRRNIRCLRFISILVDTRIRRFALMIFRSACNPITPISATQYRPISPLSLPVAASRICFDTSASRIKLPDIAAEFSARRRTAHRYLLL